MRKFLKFCVIAIMFFMLVFTVQAQEELQRDTTVPIQCGNIIDSDFVSNHEENSYAIGMNAGDTLDVSLIPIGEQLKTSMVITGPTGLGVAASNARSGDYFFDFGRVETQPKLNSGVLGADGNYIIRVVNFAFTYYFPDALLQCSSIPTPNPSSLRKEGLLNTAASLVEFKNRMLQDQENNLCDRALSR